MILDRTDDRNVYLIEKCAHLVPLLPSRHVVKYPDEYALVLESERGNREYRYNISTPYEAAASAVYFKEYGGNLSPEQQKSTAIAINDALRSYGIPEDIEIEKTANLKLGYTDAAGNPLNDAAESELLRLLGVREDATVEAMELEASKQTPRGKRKLFLQAKYAGVDLPFLEDYGGTGFGTDLAHSLIFRETILEDKEKVASLRRELLDKSPEECVTLLEQFDYANNLCQFYDLKDLPDPVESVYGHKAEKLALDFSTITLGDVTYSEGDFSTRFERHREYFNNSLGTHVVDSISRNPAEVVNSLPDYIKDAIGYRIND